MAEKGAIYSVLPTMIPTATYKQTFYTQKNPYFTVSIVGNTACIWKPSANKGEVLVWKESQGVQL